MTHKRTRTDGKWQLLSFFSSSSSNLQVWQRDRDSNGRREKRTLGGGQLEIFDFYNSENFLDRFFCCFLAHAFPVHPVWGCVTDECEFNRQEKHSPDRIGPKETFSPTAVYWQVKRSAPSLAVQQWRWLKKKTPTFLRGRREIFGRLPGRWESTTAAIQQHSANNNGGFILALNSNSFLYSFSSIQTKCHKEITRGRCGRTACYLKAITNSIRLLFHLIHQSLVLLLCEQRKRERESDVGWLAAAANALAKLKVAPKTQKKRTYLSLSYLLAAKRERRRQKGKLKISPSTALLAHSPLPSGLLLYPPRKTSPGRRKKERKKRGTIFSSGSFFGG